MPNYVLAQESNRANIPDALWYAMEETDLTDIANNESLSTGDKVYVIKANKTFIFGEDANWYPYANEGGGGGSEGVPDAPSEQGKYVLSVGASDNEWTAETKEHYEIRIYDKSKDQDWDDNENDQYVVETSQEELQEIVSKINTGGVTVSMYVYDGDGVSRTYPMCTLIRGLPTASMNVLAGLYFDFDTEDGAIAPNVMGIVMVAETCQVFQVMGASGLEVTRAVYAGYSESAYRADYAQTADTLNSTLPVNQMYPMLGMCTSSASSTAKTASINGYIEVDGITVFVAFSNANTVSDPTLNINSTRAYPIKVGSFVDPGAAGSFAPGLHAFTLVTYNGSHYWMLNEGRDTVPEAPALEGAYYLRIHSGGVSWEGATKKGTITLTPSAWTGSGPYTQTISSIIPVTVNTKIDLQPNATVLARMATDGTTNIFVDNDNATLTAYALGAKPTASLTIQYTKTEVVS